MNLQKLILQQLDKFDREFSNSKKTALLEILEKAVIVQGHNKKIVNHTDLPDIETEMVKRE